MSPPPPTTTTPKWPSTTTTTSYSATGKIMLASVTTLVAVVVLLLLLHLYTRWHLLRLQHRHAARRRNRRNRNVVVYVDGNGNGGLDGRVLKSLPVFVFNSPENDGGSPECAVCLSEFEDGDKCRKLTKCKHCFHIQCIDMWFCSNSTCPLCRSPVVVAGEPELAILVDPPESSPELGSSELVETTSFADMTKRVDVIIDESNRSELQVSSASQGLRSPASRLLSLKRMISMSRKSPAPVVSPAAGVGPSCVGVAAELDVESTSQETSREGDG